MEGSGTEWRGQAWLIDIKRISFEIRPWPVNPQASPRKYFLLAQYARHIPSCMTLLETGETNTVAAYDPKARKVVIVALKDGEAREFVFDLSRFAGVDGPISRWTTDPKADACYQSQPAPKLNGKRFRRPFPANAILAGSGGVGPSYCQNIAI